MNRHMVFIALITIFLIGLSPRVSAENDVQKGFIDLSQISLTQQDKIELEGEWEFYWKEFLFPQFFNSYDGTPQYKNVPSSWRKKEVNGKTLGSFGYATYRLQVKINPNDIGKERVLFFDFVGSAYQVFIDEEKKGGLGSVGKTRADEVPMQKISYVYFTPTKETFEIVVHVSNFAHREGGIRREVSYGLPSTIHSQTLHEQLPSLLIIGGLFVFGIYNIILFGSFRKHYDSLIIGIATLAVACRYFITNKYINFFDMDLLPWATMKKIEYLLELVAFFMLVLLMRFMYQREVHAWVMKSAYGYLTFCFLFFSLTPLKISSQFMTYHALIMATFLLYFVFYVGGTAAKRKREGAGINSIGLFILIIGIINEPLYSLQVFPTVSLLMYCVVIFILLQGIVVSYRYFKLSERNNLLNVELTKMNDQLEDKVTQRTKELYEKNIELEEVNQKLESLSIMDGLTDLPNRRELDRVLEMELQRAVNEKSSLAVVMIDVDFFKQYNDTNGHLKGDDCLKLIANVLESQMVRKGDFAARYGGEEFTVVLPNIEKQEAKRRANEIGQAIANIKEPHPDSPYGSVTISIGVAIGVPNEELNIEQWVQLADEALYKAKKNGRNRVEVIEVNV